MFLLQLLKNGKIQDLLKTGLRLLKKNNILAEGQHGMTVTITFSGENDKQAQTAIQVTYKQSKLSRYPQIIALDTTDWTISDREHD